MKTTSKPPAATRRPYGFRAFTLMEMVVVMALIGILLGGLAVIFNRAVTVARSQSDISSMQQAQRIAHQEIGHFVRMTGLGGLPMSWTVLPAENTDSDGSNDITIDETTIGAFPANGFAMAVQNNVSNPPAPFEDALPGTDILTIRGAFSSSVHYFSEPIDMAAQIGATGGIDITAEISTRVNNLYSMPIDGFVDVALSADPEPVPVILRDLSNPGAYLVADLQVQDAPAEGEVPTQYQPKACTSTGVKPAAADWEDENRYSAECITINFELNDAGAAHVKAFGDLSQGTVLQPNAGSLQIDLPAGGIRDTLQVPRKVGSIAILEEYSFYLRADREIPGDNSSRLRPTLVRVQTVPGTATVLETVDIVGGLIDLQFAFGIDLQTEIGDVGYGVITESSDGIKDEILFNHPNDLTTPPDDLPATGWYDPGVDYHYVRVSTIAQTEHPVRDRWAHQLDVLEDHDLKGTFDINGKTESFADDVGYPRSLLQSVVELRNLR